jgi:hypothetical protein
MARKYDPVLLASFKNFTEANEKTGVSKSSYFENKRKYPDLPWPKQKKGKPFMFTAEQMIQFANAKEACDALNICRDTYQKAKKDNPHLPWPKTTRHKFDPAELAGYVSAHDAMRKTGIKYNNYYKYRKKFPQFNWPKKQRNISSRRYHELKKTNKDLNWPEKKCGQPKKFDPAEISKFSCFNDAKNATGISINQYRFLKRKYKNDYVWPKNRNEIYLESLKEYNPKDLLKYKNCSEAVRQAGITRHIYENLVGKNKKINLISNEVRLEKWKKELENSPRHPLSSLLLFVNSIP